MIEAIENKPDTKRPRQMAREPKAAGAIAVPDTKLSSVVEPKPFNKSSLVLQMLQQLEGATIAQIVLATGWLPHMTGAALTGLKKKGHDITSEKIEGEERGYRVAAR
ncbi:DUF3489 domain-containing protein [Parafrankia sp. BMG5.11]|uniref:DUF3489 domain-containing protein n=1 Tax=Parafrankia sp. BMG5.11 TaxID=222540 RepID=UPI001A9F98FF|nr:DUF3489 domain-containing protein [Parafrankia sp. BMG5.11]